MTFAVSVCIGCSVWPDETTVKMQPLGMASDSTVLSPSSSISCNRVPDKGNPSFYAISDTKPYASYEVFDAFHVRARIPGDPLDLLVALKFDSDSSLRHVLIKTYNRFMDKLHYV